MQHLIHIHLRDKSAFEFAQCTEIARSFTKRNAGLFKNQKARSVYRRRTSKKDSHIKL